MGRRFWLWVGPCSPCSREGEGPRGKFLLSGVNANLQIPLSYRGEEVPVEQGQELGRILCQVAGETVAQVPIIAKERVEAVTFGAAFLALGRALFTL